MGGKGSGLYQRKSKIDIEQLIIQRDEMVDRYLELDDDEYLILKKIRDKINKYTSYHRRK